MTRQIDFDSAQQAREYFFSGETIRHHAAHDLIGFLEDLSALNYLADKEFGREEESIKQQTKTNYEEKFRRIAELILTTSFQDQRPDRTSERKKREIKRFTEFLPHFRDYIDPLCLSFRYLSEGRIGDLEELYNMKVNIAPLVKYFFGEFTGVTPDTINGAELPVYLNMLRNANKHGLNQSLIDYNPEAGYTSFSNLSKQSVSLDKEAIFRSGRYGLAISSIFATALGGVITCQSEPSSELTDGNQDYLVNFTYWHDVAQAPLAA